MAQRAEEGGVGGFGARGGAGVVGGGALLTGAAPLLRAAHHPPSPPRGGRLHLRPSPPPPSQDGDTALDIAKKKKHTEIIKLLENAPAIAAQVGRAAPHPATPPPRPCAVCDRAWSCTPGCISHSALAPCHLTTVANKDALHFFCSI